VRRFWRRGIVALTALGGAGLLLVGASPAAHGSGHVEGSPQNDFVRANGFAPGAALTFTISDGAATLFTGDRTADAGGHYFLGPWEHGEDLLPGYEVAVTDGGTPAAVTLVDLAIADVDRVNELVTGTAPPGQLGIGVGVGGPSGGGGQTVDADAGGAWSADFSVVPPFDLDLQTGAQARISDAEGDATVAESGPPSIHAALTWDGVNANGFQPNDMVDLTIRDAADVVLDSGSKPTDGMGNAFFNRGLDHDVDLVPGMKVEVTDGSATKQLTLAALTIDTVDAGANTVSGDAPDGFVDVHVNEPGQPGQFTQVEATGGLWTASFSDFGAGASAHASVGDLDGDRTGVDKGPSTIRASLNFDGVNANGFAPNGTATLTISDGSGELDTATKTADANGNAFFNRFQDHDVDLAPGLVVEVTDGTTTKDLTLVPLAITAVDPVANEVSGTATDGTVVDVHVNEPGGGNAHEQATAAGGVWTATFAFNFSAGAFVDATVSDLEGDSTAFDKPPAQIHASLTHDNVGAQGFEPNDTVHFTIREADPGNEILAEGDKLTDGNGNACCFDRFQDHNVDLAPGMKVEATDGSATKDLVLAPLTIETVDAGAGTVSGTAPDGALVDVYVNEPGGGGQHVQASAPAGFWTATFAPFSAGAGVSAQLPDEDGDRTQFDREQASIHSSLTFDNVHANGFAPNDTVHFTIKAADNVTVLAEGDKPTDGNGNACCFDRGQDHDVDLVAGLNVEATDGVVTKTLELAALTIDTVDAGANTVSGTAPDGALVDVNVNEPGGGGAHMQVTAVGGAWTAAFSFDFSSAAGVNAGVSDAEGDRTNVDKEPATIDSSLSFDNVHANGFAPNDTVHFTIKAADNVTVLAEGDKPTDGNGNACCFDRGQDHDVDLVAGLNVEATDGVVTKTLELAALTIDTVDAGANTVSGTAPDGALVNVNVNEPGGGANMQVTAVGGVWTAAFAFDFGPGAGAHAWVTDDDGDSTMVEKQPPTVDAALDWDGINGWGFTPSSIVAVAIRSAPGADPPLYENAAMPTDENGAFTLEPFQHGVDLVPGMEITVTGSTKVLVLVQITVDAIDVAADTVSGTAPAGKQVDLGFFGPSGEHDTSVLADVDGNWTANVALDDYDIVGRTEVHASVADEDFDRTSNSGFAPSLDASLTSDQVWLHGFGFDTVTISDAGGTPLFSGPPQPFCNCVGPEVHGQDLEPGMQVSATNGTNTLELTLAPVAIDSVDAGSGMVTGTAPPGADVELGVGGPFDIFTTVGADGVSGAWTADLSGSGLAPFNSVFAGVPDGEGERTFAERQPPAIEGDLVLDKVNGCGFAPEDEVTVTIGAFTSAPVPTDAFGCFGFDATAQDLAAGKTVGVTDGTIARELILAPLTIQVDYATDTVTGTADPFQDVDVTAQGDQWGDGQTVTADGSGNWTAPFDLDLALVEVRAHVNEPDGDRTTVTQSADLRWGETNFFVPEDAGSVQLTVRRIGDLQVVVGADYATADGTATAGADYTAASGTLSFPDGAEIQTFTVPITDDGAVEGDETIQLTLSNATGGAALALPFATLTITDNDSVQNAEVTAGGTATVVTDPESEQITVAMPAPNPSPLTMTATPNCPGGATPVSVTLTLGSYSTPMTDPDADGVYSATIPAGEVESGTLAIEVECPDTAYVSTIGEVVLYDPSGIVSDASTGEPIEGAEVTLYKVPSWAPDEDGVLEEGECQTGGAPWTQPAPTDLGVRVEPLGNPEIEPDRNPLITNAEGRYGWDVARGCWFIVVTKDGYVPQTSPVVGVPPAVTDLHIALAPDVTAPVVEAALVPVPVRGGRILYRVEWSCTDDVAVTSQSATYNGRPVEKGDIVRGHRKKSSTLVVTCADIADNVGTDTVVVEGADD